MKGGKNTMKWLKFYREKCGLSMQELSELINVQTNTIWRWESGRASPSVETAQQLAKIFKISETELLNGPSSGKVRVTLSYDLDKMKEGEINMDSNGFDLFLGKNGSVGIQGSAMLTSKEAIEVIVAQIREQLTIGYEAQVKRRIIAEA